MGQSCQPPKVDQGEKVLAPAEPVCSSWSPAWPMDPYVPLSQDQLDCDVASVLGSVPMPPIGREFIRLGAGQYQHNGRPIQVIREEDGLVVVDGPLRQRLESYVSFSNHDADWDVCGIGLSTALHSISKAKRMSFDDGHKMYSRLEAMWVATQQAQVREQAAAYVRDGERVPVELTKRYHQNLKRHLDPQGQQRERRAQADLRKVKAEANRTASCKTQVLEEPVSPPNDPRRRAAAQLAEARSQVPKNEQGDRQQAMITALSQSRLKQEDTTATEDWSPFGFSPASLFNSSPDR